MFLFYFFLLLYLCVVSERPMTSEENWTRILFKVKVCLEVVRGVWCLDFTVTFSDNILINVIFSQTDLTVLILIMKICNV